MIMLNDTDKCKGTGKHLTMIKNNKATGPDNTGRKQDMCQDII